MSGFPPPSRPEDPPTTAVAPASGAPLPPPAAASPAPPPAPAPAPAAAPAAPFAPPGQAPAPAFTPFAPPTVEAPAPTAPPAALPAPEFVAPLAVESVTVEPIPAEPIAVEPAPDLAADLLTPWGRGPSSGGLATDTFGTDTFGTDTFGTDTFGTDTPSTMWDDTDIDLLGSPGGDEDRSEIEELIARAEAEAAGQSGGQGGGEGGGMPLTFSPPEGVDLRAIVAAEPVEPPRSVLDASGSSPSSTGPDWLNDLVDSIEDPTDDDTAPAARPAQAATFVTADTNITARPEKARFNGFALLSLVAAIVWVCGLGSVVAVIFAVLALVQISAVHQRGRLVALAGLVLGVMGIAAAAALFVFDGGGDERTPLSTPVAFGEVIVTSCALDAAGNGVAIVRVVNLNGESVTYDITVAFQTGDQRGVARVETGSLAPDASEMVTVVSETEFDEAPVCTLQDTVRYASG